MAKKENRKRKPQRQNWQPALLVRVLYRVWKIALSALKIAAGAVATVLLICVVCGFVFISLLGDYLQDDIMPKAQINLEDYELEKTSYIYYFDADGNVQILQQLHTTMDRRWATYEELPEDLIHAAVAIEDQRFYLHQGVDWITTAKACINMFFGGSSQFGGSTITQQLIKNLELMYDQSADDVTVQRKILEIFKAQAFEKTYDKEVVLEWYMNTVYFGDGCYGVKSAAENYFGKELQDMNTAEMAALIGITNNPSMFTPYSSKVYTYEGAERDGAGRNRYRQQVVLTQMYEQGWLTEEEYLDAYNYELVYKRGLDDEDRWTYCEDLYDDNDVLISEGCGYDGPVRDLTVTETGSGKIYQCPQCGQKIDITIDASLNVYSWYVDTVLEDVAKAMAQSEGVEWNDAMRDYYVSRISRGGYHIYTPYSAEAQAAVDKIYTNLEEIPETRGGQQLQSAMVIIDNRTGDIIAMAGGVGEKDVADAYNRAEASQQVGSSLKPLSVYAPAFEAGLITPATVIEDMPLYYNNKSPYPLNDNRTYNYHRTIYHGIVSSLNAVSCNTLDMMGTQYSFNFAKHQFGLSGLTDHYVSPWNGNVLTDVGIAPLGMGALSIGASVRDVTNAYATFTNGGVYREGRTFTLVLNDEGEVVMKNEQDSRQILSQKTVDYVNYCLNSAVNEGTGTAARLFNELGINVAGKTGTTGNKYDRYFAGYTGYYTAAVWCGFDQDEEINLVGDTSNPSCRLWKKVMLQLHEGLEDIPLYNSSKMEQVSICLESGKLATPECRNDIRSSVSKFSRVTSVLVYTEDVPTEFCDCHITVDYCTSGGGVANEYCQKFHSVGAAVIDERALVKKTQADVDALVALEGKGLSSNYLSDNYIYLVDSAGNPLPFFGLHNTINRGQNIPYKGCTVHTAAAWERYKLEHPWIDGFGPTTPAPENPTIPETPSEPVPTRPVTTPDPIPTTVPQQNTQKQEP